MINRKLAFLLVASAIVLFGCLGPTGPEQAGNAGEDPLATAMAVSAGTYNIVAVHSGKCVDVAGGSTLDGANIQQWTCNGGTNQQWKLTSVASGVFTLTSVKSGKCADVYKALPDNGTNIQQWGCSGRTNQQWKAVDMGSGQYELVAQHSGKCMDVSGRSTADGANIWQYGCVGATNQKFTLKAVGSTPTPTPTPGTKKKVVLYLPNWYGGYDSWATKTDFSHMTHVNLAFGSVTSTGTTTLGQSASAINAFVTAAHNKGVKVLVSIGGAAESGAVGKWVASNRSTYVNNLVSFVNTYKLDGVDVDIEGSGVNSSYGAFVSDLINKLRPNGKLVTAALSPWFTSSISTATLQSFDFINLMAYDECGEWTSACEQSTYTVAVNMLKHYSGRGVANSKMVLGVPFYAWCWGSGCGSSEWSYAKVLSVYGSSQSAASKDWIQVSGVTLSYNGRPTITKKAQLARSYGGIMAWEYPSDATGSNSLTTLMANTLWAP